MSAVSSAPCNRPKSGKTGEGYDIALGTGYLSPEDAYAVVSWALRHGVRHFDTAQSYGTEKAVGTALKDFLDLPAEDRNDVSRDDIVLTSKYSGDKNRAPGNILSVEDAIKASLKKLNTDYVDCYLIHRPDYQTDLSGTWKSLVAVQKSGRARYIGVSNFTEAQLKEIASASSTMPSINQIELNPGVYADTKSLLEYMTSKEIAVSAYRCLAPVRTDVKKGEVDVSATGRVAEGIASAKGLKVETVLLAWALQKGVLCDAHNEAGGAPALAAQSPTLQVERERDGGSRDCLRPAYP